MDSILNSLGVSLEDEQSVQRKVVQDKILQSIEFLNILQPPSVREIPVLSTHSLHTLRKKLKDNVKSSLSGRDRDFHLIKYRFFETVCQRQGADSLPEPDLEIPLYDDVSNDSEKYQKAIVVAGDRRRSQTLPMEGIRTSRRTLVSQRVVAMTAPAIKQTETRKEMLKVIDLLHGEARSSSLTETIINGEGDEGFTERLSQKRQLPTRSPAEGNTPPQALPSRKSRRLRLPLPSKETENEDEEDGLYSPGGVDRKVSNPVSPPDQSVTCPICGECVAIGRGMAVDWVMDKHIDRCGRRTSSSVSASSAVLPSKSSASSGCRGGRPRACLDVVSQDVVDFADEEEGEEEWTPLRRASGDDKSAPTFAAELDEGEDDSFDENGQEYVDDVALRVLERDEGRSADRSRPGRSAGPIRAVNSELIDDWEQARYDERLQRYLQRGQYDIDDDADDDADVDESTGPTGVGDALSADENDDDSMRGQLLTDFGSTVERRAWAELYEYQRQGAQWMWELYRSGSGSGGILGDEMGLGKTAQLCVHFAAIATNEARDLRRASRDGELRHSPMLFIACPVTVLQHWLKEMHRWAPRVRTVILHGISPSFLALNSLGKRGVHRALMKISAASEGHDAPVGVAVIVSYEGVRRYRDVLLSIRWSAVCLDEGHKIKNPEADVTVACKALPSSHRLILSGTPIQNSLRELWSLFDFVFPGRLGTFTAFEAEFSTPIRLGGYSNASKLQAEIAVRTATTLQNMIRPYLLRRRQEDVVNCIRLPAKTEQVIFCVLSRRQREIYKDVISSPEVGRAIRLKAPAFKAIMTLRKLCNHPMLAYRQGKIQWHDQDRDGSDETAALLRSDVSWDDSGKLLVLSKILPLWQAEGHKVLVFCQMRSMLDLIDIMFCQLGLSYMRLDGTTPVRKRDGIVNRFNTDNSIFAMLLTTRTGGVGISLTAANRVVVVDPDWNPQTDIQARQRAWRLGQKREVTVFRLITKGTIEEKMYQRQIFKLLLTNRILDNPRQKRFFAKSDIRELFELGGSDYNQVETYLDLPLEGEVDLETPQSPVIASAERLSAATDGHVNAECDDYVIENVRPEVVRSAGENGNGSADDDGKEDTGRDRRLLQALFNGEAISAVYDHNYWEGGGGSGSQKKTGRSSAEDEQIRSLAKKAVDDAILQLRNSNAYASTDMNESSPAVRMQAVRASISSAAGRSSSAAASVLTGLRNIQQQRGTVGEGRGSGPTSQGQNVSILSRLQKVFQKAEERGDGTLSTEAVLSNFEDLPDQFAPIFREMLRRIARFKNGKWELNQMGDT